MIAASVFACPESQALFVPGLRLETLVAQASAVPSLGLSRQLRRRA